MFVMLTCLFFLLLLPPLSLLEDDNVGWWYVAGEFGDQRLVYFVVEVLSFLGGYDRLGWCRGAAKRCASKSPPCRVEPNRLDRSSPVSASQTRSELLEREEAVML